jgi:hypothetical protein
MSNLQTRVERLEAGNRTPCPACAPEAMRIRIRWPGEPEPPPPSEECPACGRSLAAEMAAVRAIRWPEGM